MARSPLATAALGNAPGQQKEKKKRVVGPRTLWIVLKPGSDPAAVKEQIDAVTFNGREVLRNMGTGTTPAVIKFEVAAEKRGQGGGVSGDEGEVATGEEAAVA
jgi:hypothetical protein